MSSSRVLEIDATRGAAMLGVVLSHSSQYLVPSASPLRHALIDIGMVATPTFLLLSGVICSYLGSRQEGSVSQSRWRLIDRGLFLLLIAHLAFGLTHATWQSLTAALGRSFYITDAVGVGLLAAALLMNRANRVQLLVGGVGMLLGGWLLLYTATPHDGFDRSLLRLLVGLDASDDSDEGWIVPIVPYLGIFLIGMAGGLEYAARRARDTPRHVYVRFCFLAGFVAGGFAVALKVMWLLSKQHLPAVWKPVIFQLTDPFMKIPPGLGYVLAYGGAGLLMAGVMIHLAGTAWGRRIVGSLAIVGRASLFVFLAQYWLISVPARGFHVQGGAAFWFVMLLGALCALAVLASAWDRAGGNRLLTLGLRRFAEPGAPEELVSRS